MTKISPDITQIRANLGAQESELLTMAVGEWSSLAEGARAVRLEVFVQEQRIPLALEQDAADAGAIHVLIRNRLDLPVATGRLLQVAPGVGQIGRLAVRRDMRGCGLGQLALKALMAAATRCGDREVMLHAQSSAQSFYSAHDFVPRGEVFMEAGIGHIEMVRNLVNWDNTAQ